MKYKEYIYYCPETEELHLYHLDDMVLWYNSGKRADPFVLYYIGEL